MKELNLKRKWRWLRHVAWVAGVTTFLVVLALVLFFGSGAANPLLRRLIVSRINLMTGGRAELRTVSIGWLSLHATLKGLVIHGREPSATQPFFFAEEVGVGLRGLFLGTQNFLG